PKRRDHAAGNKHVARHYPSKSALPHSDRQGFSRRPYWSGPARSRRTASTPFPTWIDSLADGSSSVRLTPETAPDVLGICSVGFAGACVVAGAERCGGVAAGRVAGAEVGVFAAWR